MKLIWEVWESISDLYIFSGEEKLGKARAIKIRNNLWKYRYLINGKSYLLIH